jgi:hypothetical protein
MAGLGRWIGVEWGARRLVQLPNLSRCALSVPSKSFAKFCMDWLCNTTRLYGQSRNVGASSSGRDLVRLGSDHGSDPMVKGDGPKGDGQLDHHKTGVE